MHSLRADVRLGSVQSRTRLQVPHLPIWGWQSVNCVQCTEAAALQVRAMQQSPLVKTVASNRLLRSAFHVSEHAGACADDILMSAMKSARKQLDVHTQ